MAVSDQKAVFVTGSPETIKWIPGSDYDAGDVVLAGTRPYINRRTRKTGEVGALDAFGGVYALTKPTQIFTFGDEIYWDAVAEEATDNSNGNVHFGTCVLESAMDDDRVRVLHFPNGIFTEGS